jgi:hypothetical protein
MVGPELLDTTQRPERLLALPADEHVAVWETGASTTRRISIQKGVPALVRMGPGHPIPVGTPVAVPGTDGLAWLAHDRVFIERPTGPAQVTYVGGAGRPPFEPRAFELSRSRMVLFATERDWIAVRGTSVRSGFAPFNAPPPQITAVSDRGPEGGIWVGLPTGVVHVAFADLLRSRVQTIGRKPSPAATILSASADGDEPGMGAVTALADLADGRLLVGAEGGLFAVSRDGAVMGRHRPFTETGQVRRFHHFAAAPGSAGDMRSLLVEAQVGLLVVKPDGSVAPVADGATARGGVAPVPGTSRLFVGTRHGTALLEIVETPRPPVAGDGSCSN